MDLNINILNYIKYVLKVMKPRNSVANNYIPTNDKKVKGDANYGCRFQLHTNQSETTNYCLNLFWIVFVDIGMLAI